MDDITRQIEDDLLRLEQHTSFTHSVRTNIINKLSAVVDNMTIDPNAEKPSAIESKMSVVNTLLKSLDDSDSQKISVIKLKQKNKDNQIKEDTNKMISSMVLEYMKKLPSSTSTLKTNSTPQADYSSLDSAVEEAGLDPILDTEIEMTTKCAKDIER